MRRCKSNKLMFNNLFLSTISKICNQISHTEIPDYFSHNIKYTAILVLLLSLTLLVPVTDKQKFKTLIMHTLKATIF